MKDQKKNTTLTHTHKILLADHERDSLTVYRTFLESLGYTVISAHEGIDALRAVYNELPDMVIIDTEMPNMNGYEVCRLLKHDSPTADIPVILLHSEDIPFKHCYGLNAGAPVYVKKNYHMPAMAQVVKGLLAREQKKLYCNVRPAKPKSDIEILTRISRILDDKLLETSLINKIMSNANASGDYEHIIRNIFSIMNNVLDYSMLGLFLKDKNEIFIDTLTPLKKDYLDWVLLKIHKECGFDYKSIVKHIVYEREPDNPNLMWDVSGDIWMRRIMAHDAYIGMIVITTLEHNGFSKSELSMMEALVNPLTTILDNTRMYAQVEETNALMEAFQQDLVEFNHNLDNKIEERTIQLQRLYDAGRALTTIHELGHLLATLINMIINLIGAEVGTAILVDEEGKVTRKIEFGLGFDIVNEIRFNDSANMPVYERVLETGEYVILNGTQVQEQLNIDGLLERNINISCLLCIPFNSASGALGFTMVINKLTSEFFSQEDIISVTTLSSMATVAIENAYLYQQTIAKTKLDADIQMAMEMQSELLPDASPESDYFDVAARYTPAEVVGGDYYDYLTIDDDNTGFVVGDVTGHGVPAAFIMTQVKVCTQLLAKGLFSTHDVVKALNAYMARNIPRNNFVSFLYAILNTKKQTLLYTSAGHNPSLMFCAKTGEFQELTTDGLFLSLFEETQYGEISIPYAPGDIFFFYTDGLTEAVDKKKIQFGIERVKLVIKQYCTLNADEIASEIYDALNKHIGKCPLDDDLTFIVLKIKK